METIAVLEKFVALFGIVAISGDVAPIDGILDVFQFLASLIWLVKGYHVHRLLQFSRRASRDQNPFSWLLGRYSIPDAVSCA